MNIYFLLILLFSSSCELFPNYEHLDNANVIFNSRLLSFVSEIALDSEGFAADTLVQKNNKYIPIQSLQNNDDVLGIYNPSQKVILIEVRQLLIWYEIELENDLILQVAPAQKLYDVTDETFKEAKNLELSDYVGPYKISKITKKEEFKKFYRLTTSDHLFIIENSILVHNVDIAQAINSTVQIGSFILKHPVILAIGRTISLSKLAIFLYEIASDAQERADKLLQALEHEEIIKETRNYYQARYKQLSDILSQYQAIEQSIVLISKRSLMNIALFTAKQYQTCNAINLIPTLSVELSYRLEQRKDLLELRKKSLEDLEKKIIDIQVSLILQLQDHYERFTQNVDNLCSLYSDAEFYIKKFYDSMSSCNSSFACTLIQKIIITQETLEVLLQQINGFKLLYQYYQHAQNAIILKHSTNITEIFWDMYCKVLSYENDFLSLRPALANIADDFLVFRLLEQSQINSIIWHIQKEGQKKNQQSEAELLTKKTNIQFPKPPDDPENKDKEKKRKYTGIGYHHQNSRGSNFGGKSAEPKDGQRGLDNSIFFKEKGNRNFERRLGREGDHFIVFDEHSPGEFHGHLRTWDELDIDMQNAIRRSHLIKK